MTYAINSSYGEKIIHPKGTTDNSVTYIKIDYVTECIDVTMHNVEEGGSLI